MSGVAQAVPGTGRGGAPCLDRRMDPWLLLCAVALASAGLVMVASASIGIAEDPLFYFRRQLVFVLAGAVIVAAAWRIPLRVSAALAVPLLILVMALLALVLIPGIGHEVNGSRRWLPLVVLNLQVSELAKLTFILYTAGYLVRRREQVRERLSGFIKPILLTLVAAVLLILEPDFGAVVVLMSVVLGMLFIAGARLWQFSALFLIAAGSMTVLAITSPYRLSRMTSFLDPWSDPYNSGFQLTQSLIAIGSGGWSGLGLGGSIQKLHYLPEAHTDFLFAVLAEELGLIGGIAVIGLFSVFVWRCFVIARRAEIAELPFAGWIAWGVGIWFGLQAFINIGVNMGVLPTKGLTLPLMSAGGSSMLVTCAAVGLVLRASREVCECYPVGTQGRPS